MANNLHWIPEGKFDNTVDFLRGKSEEFLCDSHLVMREMWEGNSHLAMMEMWEGNSETVVGSDTSPRTRESFDGNVSPISICRLRKTGIPLSTETQGREESHLRHSSCYQTYPENLAPGWGRGIMWQMGRAENREPGREKGSGMSSHEDEATT